MAYKINRVEQYDKDLQNQFKELAIRLPNFNIVNSKGEILDNLFFLKRDRAWQELIDITKYYKDNSTDLNFITTKEYTPIFNSLFSNLSLDYNNRKTNYLYVKDNKLYLSYGDTFETSTVINYFNGVPKRTILVLQGAGGGGGASSFVVSVWIPSGGGDGGNGGSGGLLAVVLNLEKLKNNSNSYYKIVLGKGGYGATAGLINDHTIILGSGNANGGNGAAGQTSYVSFFENNKETKLFTVFGGGQGLHASSWDWGKNGAAGYVNEESYDNDSDYYWKIKITSKTGKFLANGYLDGFVSGQTADPIILNPYSSTLGNLQYKTNTYPGLLQTVNDNKVEACGAPSYFAKGGAKIAGASGDANYNSDTGRAGSLGSGGAGGRYYGGTWNPTTVDRNFFATDIGKIISREWEDLWNFGFTINSDNFIYYDNTIQGGGKGGDAFFNLYF